MRSRQANRLGGVTLAAAPPVVLAMRMPLVLGLVVGLALLACDAPSPPSVAPSTVVTAAPSGTAPATSPQSQTASPVPSPEASPIAACSGGDGPTTRVVYADADDLWLYDPATDETRRLTADAATRFERDPTFVSAGCIVYANTNPSTIEMRELAVDGSSRVIVTEAGFVVSIDVSPDGRKIAYLQVDYDVDGAFRLKVLDLDRGVAVITYAFSPALGRGAGSEDEVSVAWSPDGASILVANTHEFTQQDPNGALSLFDGTGREIRRWTGTHPRWSPDGRTIYFRGYAGLNGQSWFALDVATMESTKLGIRPGTNGFVVAPDGGHVAYDTSWFGDFPLETIATRAAPNVYAFDLSTREETLLERGALGPLWISATAVIATGSEGPSPDSWNSWTSLGTVALLSLDGDRSPLDMTSTLDATVHLGP